MKTFPQVLKRNDLFPSPIWIGEDTSFIKKLNKASDPYIKESKKAAKDILNKRNKNMGDRGDMGHVYHSTSLINDTNFLDLQNYVIATSNNLLLEMGFDLTNYQVFMTEMWVQEFAKNGAGHHSLHTHWNGHISGFYFLKGSDKTSMPVFEDPRPGSLMNSLPEKDKSIISYATPQINYKPTPGKIIFFPSYMPHEFVVDMGYEPFRFIHWNCQAVPKSIVGYNK
jgi:uncharacterized protein (TIGR02466 family)